MQRVTARASRDGWLLDIGTCRLRHCGAPVVLTGTYMVQTSKRPFATLQHNQISTLRAPRMDGTASVSTHPGEKEL